MTSAKLVGTDFTGAELYATRLSLSDLTDAKLNGANLDKASLNNAKLDGADLTGATLVDAEINDTDLTNTNLTDTEMENTKLGKPAVTEQNQIPVVVAGKNSSVQCSTANKNQNHSLYPVNKIAFKKHPVKPSRVLNERKLNAMARAISNPKYF